MCVDDELADAAAADVGGFVARVRISSFSFSFSFSYGAILAVSGGAQSAVWVRRRWSAGTDMLR